VQSLPQGQKGAGEIMIRVIIERRCKPEKQAEVEKLLVELRAHAMRQPGYISGETIRSVDDPSISLVISTWTDVESWRTWEATSERKEMEARINPLLVVPVRASIFDFDKRGRR